MQPDSLQVGTFPTALGRQVSRGSHAPLASSVKRDDSAAERGSAAAAQNSEICTESRLQLSGTGWTFPIQLRDSVVTMPGKGQAPTVPLDGATLQQCQPESENEKKQRTVQTKPFPAADMQRASAKQILQPVLMADTSVGTAGLLRLTGDGWALPIKLLSPHMQTPQHAHRIQQDVLQLQMHMQTPQEAYHIQPGGVASDCSSGVGTADTIELSGQGWAMPVRLHDTVDEDAHMPLIPPKQAMPAGMPPPLLVVKADIHESPAQDYRNCQCSTLHAECDLPLISSGHHLIGQDKACMVSPSHEQYCTGATGRVTSSTLKCEMLVQP